MHHGASGAWGAHVTVEICKCMKRLFAAPRKLHSFQEYGANVKLRDEGGLLPVHCAAWLHFHRCKPDKQVTSSNKFPKKQQLSRALLAVTRIHFQHALIPTRRDVGRGPSTVTVRAAFTRRAGQAPGQLSAATF